MNRSTGHWADKLGYKQMQAVNQAEEIRLK